MLIQATELLDYLGADEDNLPEVQMARDAAIERLYRATGIDWNSVSQNKTANEAVKCMVWMDFYGLRDDLKNPEFVREHIDRLITALQYSKEVFEKYYGDEEENPALGVEEGREDLYMGTV